MRKNTLEPIVHRTDRVDDFVIKEENEDQIIISFKINAKAIHEKPKRKWYDMFKMGKPEAKTKSPTENILADLDRPSLSKREKSKQTPSANDEHNTSQSKKVAVPGARSEYDVLKFVEGGPQPHSEGDPPHAVLNEVHNKSKDEKMSVERSEKSVQSCLVCFDRLPDAVNMNCGHGGLCYECSIDIFKKTGECYLCRQSINQVLRIDSKSCDGKFIPVLAATNILTKEVVRPKPPASDFRADSSGYQDSSGVRLSLIHI
eukprot:TRINITY_DN8452_c0_g2_i1.p1 TRINITY_DN8452_c0_g2~~TRINITY_DN8452_c0_g2_i1.p1  ORF type:complete len:259 (+),score=66.15 TRINITY_DN8452_c0_g2_i1:668-1444(+)